MQREQTQGQPAANKAGREAAAPAAAKPAAAEEAPVTLLAYDQDKAAALLDVGRYTIRALVRSKELRTIRVGRHDRIPHVELERFIARQLEDVPQLRSTG